MCLISSPGGEVPEIPRQVRVIFPMPPFRFYSLLFSPFIRGFSLYFHPSDPFHILLVFTARPPLGSTQFLNLASASDHLTTIESAFFIPFFVVILKTRLQALSPDRGWNRRSVSAFPITFHRDVCGRHVPALSFFVRGFFAYGIFFLLERIPTIS